MAQFLTFPIQGGLISVNPDHVRAISSNGRYCRLHLTAGSGAIELDYVDTLGDLDFVVARLEGRQL